MDIVALNQCYFNGNMHRSKQMTLQNQIAALHNQKFNDTR